MNNNNYLSGTFYENGRMVTYNKGYRDAENITDKDEQTKAEVFEWIKENIIPRRKRQRRSKQSSYELKHIMQNDIKVYLTNNAFKTAMEIAGYKPVDMKYINSEYEIAKVKDSRYNER